MAAADARAREYLYENEPQNMSELREFIELSQLIELSQIILIKQENELNE